MHMCKSFSMLHIILRNRSKFSTAISSTLFLFFFHFLNWLPRVPCISNGQKKIENLKMKISSWQSFFPKIKMKMKLLPKWVSKWFICQPDKKKPLPVIDYICIIIAAKGTCAEKMNLFSTMRLVATIAWRVEDSGNNVIVHNKAVYSKRFSWLLMSWHVTNTVQLLPEFSPKVKGAEGRFLQIVCWGQTRTRMFSHRLRKHTCDTPWSGSYGDVLPGKVVKVCMEKEA